MGMVILRQESMGGRGSKLGEKWDDLEELAGTSIGKMNGEVISDRWALGRHWGPRERGVMSLGLAGYKKLGLRAFALTAEFPFVVTRY